jgi:hypothetical protein
MWLCVTPSVMPALLPKGDEFPMNFEGLGILFDMFIVLLSTSASWELTSQTMYVRRASNLRYHITNPAA